MEDEEKGGASADEEGSNTSEPAVQPPLRFGKRPLKQSALRRSINVQDGLGGDDASKDGKDGEEEQDDGPVVVRPAISRSGSTRTKKRMSTSSRMSFGGDDLDAADDSASVSTPPRRTGGGGGGSGGGGGASSLSQRVLETNAFRSSLLGRLPTRPHDADDDGYGRHDGDDDDSRPRYSKEYLEELQSSTPNTPRNLSSRKEEGARVAADDDGDAMELDASELEGAVVVDASDLAALRAAAPPAPAAHVLTATEIQERKDRRARLAREQDVIALGSDDDEEVGYISLIDKRTAGSKKKEETRLVREDEDLGEGFDEFVEDGGLSLGRKAERAARRRRKQEMTALIDAAEADGDDDGDGHGPSQGGHNGHDDGSDSEAERRAAYNAAQTRAGMDGLHRPIPHADGDAAVVGTAAAIPKMRPLPELADCLARMQGTVQALAAEVAQRRLRLAEAEREKTEIAAREAEVQKVLDAAGQKYQAVLGGSGKAAAVAAAAAATQSPLRSLPPGLASEASAERGLESLGATPTRRPDVDSVF